jgi:acyl-CoA thioester hydrolase
MQQPERLDRERMAHDRTNHPVAAILAVTKSVTVLDAHIPPGDLTVPWPDEIADADILTQHFATPAIVIARDPKDIHARILELGERGERAKTVARNHALPLEPEVEQVTIDDQRRGFSGQATEKRDERPLDLGTRDAQVRVRHYVAGGVEHGSSYLCGAGFTKHCARGIFASPYPMTPHSNSGTAHTVEFRVRYAETDQMQVVYHSNYLIWCEIGRTEFIRALGTPYAELERQNVTLAVVEASLRFHSAARYDNLIRVTTTIRDVRSRTISFDYVITNAETGERFVTASTKLASLTRESRLTTLPESLRKVLSDASS